jgi:hypothetical protein
VAETLDPATQRRLGVGLARAYAPAGDGAKAKGFRDLGLAATAQMRDDDDRRHLEADFSTIPL